MTHIKTQIITLVPVAQFLSVRPIFASTESQESKYYIGVRNRMRQCALRPVLRFEMVISFEGGFKMKNVFSKMFLKWPKYRVYKFSAKKFFEQKSAFLKAIDL